MLSFLKTKRSAGGLNAICLQPAGLSFVRATSANGVAAQVTAWDFRPWNGDNRAKALARLSADYGLKREPTVLVLNPDEYKLLLTEAPDVRPDELKAAVRWRIKDLIDFHINDATLDVFELPNTGPSGANRLMCVVVAKNQLIQERVDLMNAAGIALDIIDIPELAQRNLAALLPEDATGVVVLSLHDHGGLITVTKGNEIYLSRSVDAGLDGLTHGSDTSEYFDRIVLEVQRSLDYYDSHFRQAPIRNLVLAPTLVEIAGLLEHLNNNLNVRAAPLDLGNVLAGARAMSHEMQARCLTALGGALRRESKVL